MNKIFFREEGQSVVLIAVSILLIVFVGLSVFTLGEALNAKSQFRNISDAVSFAGTCAQQKGISTFQSLKNLNPLVVMSYYLGSALYNLYVGAKALMKVNPSYDPTANIIVSSQIGSLIAPYDDIIFTLTSSPEDPYLFDSILYKETLSFFDAETVILSQEVAGKNLELSAKKLTGLKIISLPSEVYLIRGPILNSEVPVHFEYEIRIKKNGKLQLKFYRKVGDIDEIAGSGTLTLMVADLPAFSFQNILPKVESEKIGKILSLSYSRPFPEGVEEGEPIVESMKAVNMELSQLNQTCNQLAKEMQNEAEKDNPNGGKIQNYWDSMVSTYNSLLDFLDSNNFRAAFGLNPLSYNLKPVMASLKDMGLLNLASYRNLASQKGYDINNEEDIQDFYKNLTLKDIFGTEENFKNAIECSLDTFSEDRMNINSHLSSLMDKIKIFNKDYASGNNIPYILTNFVDIIYENLDESTLADFLEVLQIIANGINVTYADLSDFNTLVSLRSDYNLDSLKPDEGFYELLHYFFETPLIKLEGT
jgi:hypothetical protein